LYTKYRFNNQDVEVSDIPVSFISPSKEEPIDRNISGNKGDVHYAVEKTPLEGSMNKIIAVLNTDSYFKEDNLWLQELLINKNQLPQTYFYIKKIPVVAYMETEEFYLDENQKAKPVSDLIRKELSSKIFDFTDQKNRADVMVSLDIMTKEHSYNDKFDVYTTYTNCNISIINLTTGTKIYNTSVAGIKGMQNDDYNRAAGQALQKLQDKLENEVIPEIMKIKL